jgi:hypothetical protein
MEQKKKRKKKLVSMTVGGHDLHWHEDDVDST